MPGRLVSGESINGEVCDNNEWGECNNSDKDSIGWRPRDLVKLVKPRDITQSTGKDVPQRPRTVCMVDIATPV